MGMIFPESVSGFEPLAHPVSSNKTLLPSGDAKLQSLLSTTVVELWIMRSQDLTRNAGASGCTFLATPPPST